MSPAARRILISVVAIVVVAIGVGLWIIRGPGPLAFAEGPKVALTDYRGANLTGVPAALAQASLVERGAYLARAADCMACHTTQGGKEYAGGLGFKLPFGTLYSTNITPDKETGIGNYSDQDFLGAVHRGIRRDGARLYPAMPFTSYTYMTDADALAIKAYLFSLPPVRTPIPENTLTFPFNQRWTMIFWSALFNPDRRFEPDTSKSPEWNRGAYLTEALAHCGECHTPRNLAFALNNRQKFAGAVTAGWRAFNISSDKNTGVGAWSDDDLVSYLSIGHADGHGTASGPMGEAVDHSLSYLAQQDIRAVVTYLRTDRREPDLALCHAYRYVGGQRSQRGQCRPDRDFRHQAPCAGGRDLDACIRQRAFRRRNRSGGQLRHRALRQQGVATHGAGRGGAAQAGVGVAALSTQRPSYPAHAGYPVRRALSIPSSASLEYWITRMRG